MHSIGIRNLNYRVGNFSLNCSEINVEFKNILALVGNSGCGKTTLLRILLGIEAGGPDFVWTLDSTEMSKLPIGQKRIGMVFQDYALFPHLSCRENILYPAGARSEQVSELINQLDLLRCQGTRAELLSGGEKQRTALARALAFNPRILFLDEPFSALDSEHRISARENLYKVVQSSRLPTILVTHSLEDLMDIPVTILRFNQGSFFVESRD